VPVIIIPYKYGVLGLAELSGTSMNVWIFSGVNDAWTTGAVAVRFVTSL